MKNPGEGDPLHGITLEQIVTRIDIRCFTSDPSVTSSLKFLRRTPWARKKVETLYLRGPRTE